MMSIMDLSTAERLIILSCGLLLSGVFVWLGLLVGRGKRYQLIAGYNRAPDELKKQYDIEGLANHLGGGLVTLGVLLAVSTLFFVLNWLTAAALTMGLFLFIVAIVVIGGQKFLPAHRKLVQESPSDARHSFLRRILPASIYRALKRGTRQWLQECRRCGHRRDFWEAGGIRHGGFGEPSKLQFCEQCGKVRWHRIRKKTAAEAREL